MHTVATANANVDAKAASWSASCPHPIAWLDDRYYGPLTVMSLHCASFFSVHACLSSFYAILRR